jgi:hypothetical protein
VGRIRNHLRIEASYPAGWIRSQGLPMDSNYLTILKWQWCWAIYTCIDVYFQSTYIYTHIMYMYIQHYSTVKTDTINLAVAGRSTFWWVLRDISLQRISSFAPTILTKQGKKLTYGFVVWKVIGKNTGKIGGHPVLNPIHFSR